MEKSLMEMKDKLSKELAEMVQRRDITVQDLDVIYKAVKSIYYLTTISAMNEYDKDSYGRDSYGRRSMDMNKDSYRMMSRDDHDRRGESFGYSCTSKDQMIAELENMMHTTSDAHEQNAIRECINRIRG